MLSKLHSTHSSNKYYLKPKSEKVPSFGIDHFAGKVYYDVKGMGDFYLFYYYSYSELIVFSLCYNIPFCFRIS